MNDNRTASILQRAPRILAVTAASYGLTGQATGHRTGPQLRAAPTGSAHATGHRSRRKAAAGH